MARTSFKRSLPAGKARNTGGSSATTKYPPIAGRPFAAGKRSGRERRRHGAGLSGAGTRQFTVGLAVVCTTQHRGRNHTLKQRQGFVPSRCCAGVPVVSCFVPLRRWEGEALYELLESIVRRR